MPFTERQKPDFHVKPKHTMATPDLTEAELTQWLQQYDAHPDIPEHPAQSVDLSNWLHSEDFDASRVVKKEMEGKVFQSCVLSFAVYQCCSTFIVSECFWCQNATIPDEAQDHLIWQFLEQAVSSSFSFFQSLFSRLKLGCAALGRILCSWS